MKLRPTRSQKGTVILVTLCFVAVIGIVLASYITICSRAMTLSGRSGQSGLSKQLAELGLEEALRAFNLNVLSGTSASAGLADWSANGITVDWTLDSTNKRATATISFSSPSAKFGTSVKSASVKIRVDNYDAAQLPSTWNSSTYYRPGNLVGYNGTWYRCIASHSNKTPSATNSNSTYWIQEHSEISASMTWVSGTAYVSGNMVLRNGSWYRCKADHTASSASQPPVGGSWSTYWVAVPYVSADSDLHYNNEAIVRYYVTTYGNNAWYRYNGGGWWDNITSVTWPWTLTWHWATSTDYDIGDVVSYSNVWYRCKTAHNSGASFSTTNWDTATTLATNAAAAWNWNANFNYNVGDAVYYSGSWYRCLVAHSNQMPPNTAYWSTSPLLSNAWDTYRQYSANDTVFYNGTWYRSLLSSNYGQNPATATSYWASAANSSYQWNSTTAYSAGAYRSYGGVWYKCLAGNTGKSPNNTTYWTASWANSSGATTGAPVAYAEGTVTLGDSTTTTQLRATLAPAPLFPNAVGSTTTLTISGGGTIDSYDSVADPTASSPGYSAVLAATNTDAAATAVSIFGTDVKGYVAAPSSSTSPYAPLFSSGGSVKGASSPASPSIDLTHVSRSPYVPAFSPQPSPSLSSAFSSWNFPYGTDLAPLLSSTTDLGTPGATTPARYYHDGALDIGSGYTCSTLNIKGPVILYTNGHLRLRSGGTINLAETGSAEIHLDGGIKVDSTSNGYINNTLDPKKLILISDVTGTTTQYYAATANPFYGVIYAPNTTATLGFDIRTGVTLYGAVSARKVTFSSEANVHYDTTLRSATLPGIDQPYAIAQWRELTDAVELATLP
jgi:hypothetical protein